MTFIDKKITKGQLSQAVTPYPADNFIGCSFMPPTRGFSAFLGTTTPSGFPILFSVGATDINAQTQGFIQEWIKTGSGSGGIKQTASQTINTGDLGEEFSLSVGDAISGTGVFDTSIHVLYPDVLPAGLTVGTTIRGSYLVSVSLITTFSPLDVITNIYLMSSGGALTSIGTNTISLGSITTSDYKYREFSATTTPQVSSAGDRILVKHQITGDQVSNSSFGSSVNLLFGSCGSSKSTAETLGCRPIEISIA